jgi:plastocyanin
LVLVGLVLALTLVAGVVAVIAFSGETGSTGGDEANGSTIREVTITGHDLRFEPAEVRLVAGEPVRLTFVNAGSVEHDVSIPGLNATGNALNADHGGGHDSAGGHMHDSSAMAPGTVHLAVSPGERVSVEFTPSAGTFEATCTYAGHREAGMVGTIISE